MNLSTQLLAHPPEVASPHVALQQQQVAVSAQLPNLGHKPTGQQERRQGMLSALGCLQLLRLRTHAPAACCPLPQPQASAMHATVCRGTASHALTLPAPSILQGMRACGMADGDCQPGHHTRTHTHTCVQCEQRSGSGSHRPSSHPLTHARVVQPRQHQHVWVGCRADIVHGAAGSSQQASTCTRQVGRGRSGPSQPNATHTHTHVHTHTYVHCTRTNVNATTHTQDNGSNALATRGGLTSSTGSCCPHCATCIAHLPVALHVVVELLLLRVAPLLPLYHCSTGGEDSGARRAAGNGLKARGRQQRQAEASQAGCHPSPITRMMAAVGRHSHPA